MAGIKQLGHVGIYCTDLQRSKDFYSRVLGLKVTDAAADGWITFLSSQPEDEHHQVALVPGRDVPSGAKLMQQVSFVVEDVKALKEYYQRLKQEGVRIERTVNHGISLSIYCFDPDDNRIELYAKMPYRTPYNVPQPFSEPIDLELPEEELLAIAGRSGQS